jgi:hypothetical protein
VHRASNVVLGLRFLLSVFGGAANAQVGPPSRREFLDPADDLTCADSAVSGKWPSADIRRLEVTITEHELKFVCKSKTPETAPEGSNIILWLNASGEGAKPASARFSAQVAAHEVLDPNAGWSPKKEDEQKLIREGASSTPNVSVPLALLALLAGACLCARGRGLPLECLPPT